MRHLKFPIFTSFKYYNNIIKYQIIKTFVCVPEHLSKYRLGPFAYKGAIC